MLIKPELHSREIGGYRCESTFFQLSNQISVDFMLEEHPFIFIKLGYLEDSNAVAHSVAIDTGIS